jgi:Plavaka transposase
LSYKNSDELNKIINNKLPGQPQFKHNEVVQSGEAFKFYLHDIIECLEALWGDPNFVNDLITESECHYADGDMTVQMYHDMHTGKWWWMTQV